MARMIPPRISDSVKSRGERQIFELLKRDPNTEDWTVLHSLGLAEHTKRLFGEIDFLVLAPGLGIFCLEVKSGEISREQGEWKFTNMFGHTATKQRGPFEQAQEYMHSLKRVIAKEYTYKHKLSNLLYDYGVMFPHIEFSVKGLEYEPWQVYDKTSRREPVSEFIKSLATGSRKKVKDCKWFDPKKSLPSTKDIGQLVHFLRGDFERIITIKDQMGDIEEEIIKYTEEQYRSLDQLQDNPRCLFRGAAGTGKTMIAIESLRQSKFSGERTLLVCYNILLGSWLKERFKKSSNGNLVVDSYHEFLHELAGNKISPGHKEDDKFYEEELPLAALLSIDEGIIEPFDRVIIDEGQDLIRPEYLDVLDALVKGGLSGGKWEMYADFERQAIYADFSLDDMVEMLRKRASFVNFRLRVNCRNTKPIGEDISLLTGFEEPPFLPSKIDGLPVKYSFFKNYDEEVEQLENTIKHLYSQNIEPHNITILSAYKYEKSCVSYLNQQKYPLEILDKKEPLKFMNSKKITYTTIHSFKGLENSYIILTDLNYITKDYFKSLLYVGMSRARFGLYVLINKKCHKDYRELMEKRTN